MMTDSTLLDVMRMRKSIRSFQKQPLSSKHIDLISQYINNEENLIGPFGEKGKIELVSVTNNVSDKGIKLGTYGMIKNPQAYLVGITENNKQSLLDFGYVFQKLILLLTQHGIGTCWMGGTFNRNSFEKEIPLIDKKFIPCITPIGYPHEKQRVLDKALRFAVKADNKKPWDQLFFDENFETSLTDAKAEIIKIPIEMVRLGPSASNKQPWRLVINANKTICHFFIEQTPNYSTKLGYDMQLLDMGIAMCQFDSACRELGIDGQWKVVDPEIDTPNELTKYIVSWKSTSLFS
ncbi:nitroreductase family protein [Bacillus marasmi]|uniref:nitroreductase family protein n=1 Tax=Bacillus marasmi TaxID=1926279 RepID=UPI0011C8E231|nr:nitroreductase family protein [Bacillus marasmi]